VAFCEHGIEPMGSIKNKRAVKSCYEWLFVVSPKTLDSNLVSDPSPIYIVCHLLAIGYHHILKWLLYNLYSKKKKGRITNCDAV
jgi:hypothetical protein